MNGTGMVNELKTCLPIQELCERLKSAVLTPGLVLRDLKQPWLTPYPKQYNQVDLNPVVALPSGPTPT